MSTNLVIPKFLYGTNPPEHISDGTIYVNVLSQEMIVGNVGKVDLSGAVSKETIEEYGSRITAVEQSISGLTPQGQEDLVQRVGAVESSIESIGSTVSSQSSVIDNAASAVESLGGRVDTIEGAITEINGSIDDVESSVSSIDARVSAIEANPGQGGGASPSSYTEIKLTKDDKDKTVTLVDGGSYNIDAREYAGTVTFTMADSTAFANAIVMIELGQDTNVVFDEKFDIVSANEFEDFHKYILGMKAFGPTTEGSYKALVIETKAETGWDRSYIKTFFDEVNLDTTEAVDIDPIEFVEAEFVNNNLLSDDEDDETIHAEIYSDDANCEAYIDENDGHLKCAAFNGTGDLLVKLSVVLDSLSIIDEQSGDYIYKEEYYKVVKFHINGTSGEQESNGGDNGGDNGGEQGGETPSPSQEPSGDDSGDSGLPETIEVQFDGPDVQMPGGQSPAGTYTNNGSGVYTNGNSPYTIENVGTNWRLLYSGTPVDSTMGPITENGPVGDYGSNVTVVIPD